MGTRAAMPYACWTRAETDSTLLGLAISGLLDPNDTRLAAWMHRWQKAQTVFDYRNAQDNLFSIAHITGNGPSAPTGYNGGAGTNASTPWGDLRPIYKVPPTQEVAWAVARYFRVGLAPPSAFSSASDASFKRWEGRGGATLAYDSGETACKVTIGTALGGIGNIARNWIGTEPSTGSANRDAAAGYNNTGHLKLRKSTSYDVSYRAKAGTYGAHPLAVIINGTAVTMTAGDLSAGAYTVFDGIYTQGTSDAMGDVKVIGTGTFTGTVFFKPSTSGGASISIRAR